MPILQKVQNAFKKDKETDSSAASTEATSPAFNDKKVIVIYVLGGPGAGWSSPRAASVLLTLIVTHQEKARSALF